MILQFTPENHEYSSGDATDWVSVTSFISHFKQPFDAEKQSRSSSKNKKSKWYGMSPELIRLAWKKESTRSTDLGTWYHEQRERDICELKTLERSGLALPIIKPVNRETDGVRIAPSQKLSDGIYPEHFVYLKSAEICGQSDLVEVIRSTVNITDYKTNKEIKTKGFTTWEGVVTKMKPPLAHLDDCHLNHYALQLSMYLFIILKHNPRLKPGKLTVQHVLFGEAGRDKYDNPITELDVYGEPVLKAVVPYEVPYLKKEVMSLINWLDDHRSIIKLIV